MKLPTIYKKDTSGKTRTWTIEVEDNKYRVTSGTKGGKEVTAKWTVCKGKNPGKANATTDEEQALKEAHAKRKLKLEDEYFESEEQIDSSNFKKPMRANEYKEVIKLHPLEFPVYCQPKLDGMRCKVTKDGMFSRNGNPIVGAPHIRKALQGVFDKYPTFEFDGELYNHALHDNFDALISMLRKGKPSAEDLEKSSKEVYYWMYDCCHEPDAIFSDRLQAIENVASLTEGTCLVLTPTDICNEQAGVDFYYGVYLESNFEGQMIRRNTPYEFKRTNALLKRKEWITEEFEILDVIEGDGNRSGMAGKVLMQMTTGLTFESNIKGDQKTYCQELLNNKQKYIKKMATVRYQNLTPKGRPRFPEMLTIRDYE